MQDIELPLHKQPARGVRRAGRHPLSCLQTKAWLSALQRAVAVKMHREGKLDSDQLPNPSRIETELDCLDPKGGWSNSKALCRYARGDRNPSRGIAEKVEAYFPGTLDVYDFGPARSYLWQALGERPDEALYNLEREWRNGSVLCDLRLNRSNVLTFVAPLWIAIRREGKSDLVNLDDWLQPWQRPDEYLGELTDLAEPRDSDDFTVLQLGFGQVVFDGDTGFEMPTLRNLYGTPVGQNSAAILPAMASATYRIAHAHCYSLPLQIDLDVFSEYDISREDLDKVLRDLGDTMMVTTQVP